MAQWVKMPAAKHNDLSSNPWYHMVEGENLLSKLSSDIHIHTIVCPPKQINR